MATLIIGGTGNIGRYTALQLRERGEDVVVAGRNAPGPNSALQDFPFIKGDFTKGEFSVDQMRAFDTIIFSAAVDSRLLPKNMPIEERDALFLKVNGEEIPAFYQRARDAGVRRMAYIGSFYPQARPNSVERFPYVKSRLLADERTRALATDSFHVVSLNAPAIVCGDASLPRDRHCDLARLALGVDVGFPFFAPIGGMNLMSIQSLYEAIVGGLEHGENGRGYLVGDENLTYADLLRMYLKAAGRDDVDFPVLNQTHPLFGSQWAPINEEPVHYEPEGVKELHYRRYDIMRTVQGIVDDVKASIS